MHLLISTAEETASDVKEEKIFHVLCSSYVSSETRVLLVRSWSDLIDSAPVWLFYCSRGHLHVLNI